MGDKILAILSIASGTALISIWIISSILNFLKGRKVLNGKIIGIDHEKQSLMIRYKIGKETYNEIEYRKSSCFLSNKIPKIGLAEGECNSRQRRLISAFISSACNKNDDRFRNRLYSYKQTSRSSEACRTWLSSYYRWNLNTYRDILTRIT